MDIRLRVTDKLADALTASANDAGTSRHELIVNILQRYVDDNPTGIVLAWIKVDRWGEIDDRNEIDDAYAACPECGQDIDTANAWFAVMSNGKLAGPRCAACATSA